MQQDVMDTVIGASQPSQSEVDASQRYTRSAVEASNAGQREGAIAELRKAIASDPTNTEALFQLGRLLDLSGEEEEAIAMYELCVDTPPASINALINLAVLYEDQCNYNQSEKCLRQILETDPNHARAKLFMRDILASRDMYYDEELDRDLLRRNAMLDTPVTDFELTVRARNCLKKMNIRSLGDLLRVTESELLSYKNFGEASMIEIRDMLTARGLRLGQRADEAQRHIRRQIYDKARQHGAEQSLDRPINDLNLSVRARKALQSLGIHTIGELAAKTEAELMGVKNFGMTSLDEVKESLAEIHLQLRYIETEE